MTAEERNVMIEIIKQLDTELKFPSDSMQNRIIVGFKNLLLRYAQRFYNRQFVTRIVQNNDILSRFENLIKDYYEGEKQYETGVPKVQYCS